ncbi:DNA cytosine methyltransferase [Aeromonas sp. NJAU223]|uniref:DNA cytosine methyltransferase n=1 Tax=Aeromonas sp. NJAU223 TaxID=3115650 RepID=UPI003DAA1724
MNHSVFSFFSGSGFLDLGFEKAGFNVVFVNELNKDFLNAYKYSRKKMGISEPEFGHFLNSIDDFLDGPLSSELKTMVSSARIKSESIGFIGGPPCPDFSVAGKNKGHDGENGRLSKSYIDLIIKNKPDWFVFENVKGLWRTKKHREFYESIKKQLQDADYAITERLINSIEFGAPQDRDRIIMFGSLNHKDEDMSTFSWEKYMPFPNQMAFNYSWPTQTPFNSTPGKAEVPEELTVNWWFKENNVDEHPNSQHYFTPRAGLAKFMVIDEGDTTKKSYKRLHRWRYSPTAAYGNNEVHLHPWLPRRISAAEALAIQSLPKEFELPPTMTLSAMFKTIGNGVPYKFSYGIAKTIADFME